MPKANPSPANSDGPDRHDEPESYHAGTGGTDVEGAEAQAVAQYLGDMIGQLEAMARAAKLDLLVYLLAMAREEAQAHARLALGGLDSPGRTR